MPYVKKMVSVLLYKRLSTSSHFKKILANFMEHIPSWEGKNHSAGKEITHLL
jgi:hypothetical protein